MILFYIQVDMSILAYKIYRGWCIIPWILVKSMWILKCLFLLYSCYENDGDNIMSMYLKFILIMVSCWWDFVACFYLLYRSFRAILTMGKRVEIREVLFVFSAAISRPNQWHSLMPVDRLRSEKATKASI